MNTAVRAPLKAANRETAILESLFWPMGVDGVYARTRLYEDVIDAFGIDGLAIALFTTP